MNLEGKWKAIIVGGLIVGLTPFVPLLNLACCLTPIIGGVVAVAVYKGSQPPELNNNDGVVLGVMCGITGTVLYAVLAVPLALFVGRIVGGFFARFLPDFTDLPGNVRQLLQGIFSNLGNLIGIILLARIISQLAISIVFGIIGGLIGVALFRRPSSQQIP